MRILVTGGGGFLGSHLVDLLLPERHDVTVVDSFVTSSPANLAHLRGQPRLRVLRRDVRRTPYDRYDRVFHLASPASPEDYGAMPVETLLTNALGTWRALEVARRAGARFLLASTSEVYGDPLEHPQRETYFGNVDPVGPRSSYDEGKRFSEALTMSYVRAQALDARIVRIFNAYGPRMRPADGRMPSAFIVAALAGRPIPVQGSGRHTRSLCFVIDVARGCIAAMRRGRRGEVYNIGDPREETVLAFARRVRRLAGSTAPIVHVAARPQDPRRRKPDIGKAARELGWKPGTRPDDGLRETIAWYREVNG